jgi:hypothetical protein
MQQEQKSSLSRKTIKLMFLRLLTVHTCIIAVEMERREKGLKVDSHQNKDSLYYLLFLDVETTGILLTTPNSNPMR